MVDLPVFNYPESLQFLSGFEQSTIKLGLERIRSLLDGLDRPETNFDAVHIAGTNGKGSVAAFLDALLASNQNLVGRFVSPHLVSPRERILIDGVPITRQWFAAAMSRMRDVIGELDIRPSYFELMTGMACYVFSFMQVDWAVLETGLGGRLDATNAAHTKLTVITNISLDHTQLLGTSLEAIAGEKAGIIKTGVPVVTFADTPSFPVIQTVAKKRSAPVVPLLNRDIHVDEDSRVTVNVPGGSIMARCPLPGAYQTENLALALRAYQALTGETGDMTGRLAGLVWPARMETLSTQPEIVLDGAHNIQGIQAFIDSVGPARPGDLLVFGCMKDKQATDMYQALKGHFPDMVLTAGAYHRFMGPEDFAGNSVFTDPFVPLNQLADAMTHCQRTLVCGSLHLLGDVIHTLAKLPGFREVILEKKPYSDLLDDDPA